MKRLLEFLKSYLGQIIALALAAVSAAAGQRIASIFLAVGAVSFWIAEVLSTRREITRFMRFICATTLLQEQLLRDHKGLRAELERSFTKADIDRFMKEVEGWSIERRRSFLADCPHKYAKR